MPEVKLIMKKELIMVFTRGYKVMQYSIQKIDSSTVQVRLDHTNWNYEELDPIPSLTHDKTLQQVIVDMSVVKHITTAGFAQLLYWKQQLKKAGTKMRVRGLVGQPLKLCEVLRLHDTLMGLSRATTSEKELKMVCSEL